VSPVFGFGLASGELISFDVPTGEPTVRPSRPVLPPAGEMSQTVPRALDLAEGGRRHGVDPGLDLGSSAGPFVALSPGGPNDPLGPAG
jgi:hypothetical protein